MNDCASMVHALEAYVFNSAHPHTQAMLTRFSAANSAAVLP
jgi:hypothetical protein